MKILQVVPTYLPATRYGGPIHSVHGLSRALVGLGHEVHVATTNVDGSGVSAVPLDRAVDLDGVQVRYFASSFARLYYAPQMARFFAEYIVGYDVVHLHSVFLWPTKAAARWAYKKKIPYILSPRGMLVSDLIRAKRRWLKWAWITLIERRSLARAGAIHFTTTREQQDYAALGLPMSCSAIVPNGVAEASQGDAPDLVKRLDNPYLLYVGRIDWKKGLEHLIQAMQQLPELHLVIAGQDDQGLLAGMLQRAAQWRQRIHYIGSVSEEKWALYAHAEALVLPSLSENFANVVVEAAQMACPAILSPGVGLAKEWESSGAAIICQPSAQALVEAVAQLRAQRMRMAQNAQRLWPGFRWPIVAQATVDVYSEVLGRA